jgi:hypothetical protein
LSYWAPPICWSLFTISTLPLRHRLA